MKKYILSLVLLFGIVLSGCGKKSDTEYMDMANKSLKQNNIAQAVESYSKLIDDYPNSSIAPDAMFQLATLYQNNLVKNISEKDSFEKAVKLFETVNEKYPDNKLASRALFMSGFILANDIHDYTRATVVFREFLQKYPDNDLTASAREELSNMGMTPAEILEKKKDTKI